MRSRARPLLSSVRPAHLNPDHTVRVKDVLTLDKLPLERVENAMEMLVGQVKRGVKRPNGFGQRGHVHLAGGHRRRSHDADE